MKVRFFFPLLLLCIQLIAESKSDLKGWFIYSPKLALLSEKENITDTCDRVQDLRMLCQDAEK